MDINYPFDLQSEKDIICAAFYFKEGESRDQILSMLDADTFYDKLHCKIFKVFQKLYEQGREFDFATVQAEVKDKEFNVFDFLQEEKILEWHVPERINHLRILQIKRTLISLAVKTIEEIEETTDVVQLISALEEGLENCHKLRNDKTYREFTDLVDINMKKLKDYADGNEDADNSIYPGLADLPWRLEPGRMYIIAGRPSHGKTTLALQIEKAVAFKKESPVVHFSLEETDEQVVERILKNHIGLSEFLYNSKWEIVEKRAKELKNNCKIIVISDPKLNIGTLRARIRSLVAQSNIPLICVDYIQLMRGYAHKRYNSEREELTDISRGLKTIAIECNIPIIVVSQLNREADDRVNKRPQLSDLRGSGCLEQDADIVCFVYREECYTPTNTLVANQIELITAKHKFGKPSTSLYEFVGSTYTINAKEKIPIGEPDKDMDVTDAHRGAITPAEQEVIDNSLPF